MASGPNPSMIGSMLSTVTGPLAGGLIGVVLALATVYVWLKRSGRLDRSATVEAAGRAHEILDGAAEKSVALSDGRVASTVEQVEGLRTQLEHERRERHVLEDRCARLQSRLRRAEVRRSDVRAQLIDQLRRLPEEDDLPRRRDRADLTRTTAAEEQALATAAVADALLRAGFRLRMTASVQGVETEVPPARISEDIGVVEDTA